MIIFANELEYEEMLAVELTHEFDNGFSERYLRAFRQFYLVIPNYEIWKSRFPNLLRTHIYRSLRVGDETAIIHVTGTGE